MPGLLPALEAQRANIQQQISQLGDMRTGSITTTGGRCGTPRCHCHQQDDPGHGPFYRLTHTGSSRITAISSASLARRPAFRRVNRSLRYCPYSARLPNSRCGFTP
jgi:uncharacterized protein DUF6788